MGDRGARRTFNGEKNQAVREKMKKIIVAAIIMSGAGLATSQAGTFFGITFGSGRIYEGSSYPQPVYDYSYGAPYQTYQYAQPSYGYSAPVPIYQYPYGLHRDLHQELGAEHQDLHQDLDAQHAAEHQQLANEAAVGVPWWELALQHRAEHRQLDAQHWDRHEQLEGEHAAGHDQLGW